MYFFYPLIAALDGHDGITYILRRIPFQLQSLRPGFMDMDTTENNFSETRSATVPATFDRSPTRSLLLWLNVLRGVEGLRDAIRGRPHCIKSTAPDVL